MQLWNLLEQARREHSGRPAMLWNGAQLSWSEVFERCRALATGLAARDVSDGDRILLQRTNEPLYLEMTFAAAALGAVLVPASPRLARAELADLIARCSPRLHITPESDADSWLDDAPNPQWSPVPADPERLAQLYFTSGTTGEPKGVMLTHGNLVRHARAAQSEFDLAPTDVWGHIAPLFHLADAWAVGAITAAGGCHCYLPQFEAQAAVELLRAQRVTLTNLVPTHLGRMLASLPDDATPMPHLRLLLSGGAPAAPSLVRDVLARLCPEYVQTYGMTETSPFLTLSLLEPHHRQQNSAAQLDVRCSTGRPYAGVDLQVVDEHGAEVPRDRKTVGEIRVRGASISPGYWNNPAATESAFRHGWLHTGDLATRDAEGYVRIVDRLKDMVLTGGENVYTIEVERALYEHPAVLEAAAYGIPSRDW
ncbi:MAG: fatty-acyl-CoA synthase, partial [Planctomycetota bacterium]